MVGVPRSKGCATCRRRKVACDQQKPHCLACQKRGVICEGYAQYSVILQWTTSGLKKRRRFEEVARTPSAPRDSGALDTAGQPNESPSALDFDRSIILQRQASVATLILGQIQMRCLESYLPISGAVTPAVKSSWMWSAFTVSDHGRALTCSVTALSLARMGLILKDRSLIAQGRAQYALALASLQYALYDPVLAFQGNTLAAIRALSIYELFIPTFGNRPSPTRRDHETGMTQWCLAAGPQCFSTEFAVHVFEDVRWSIMTRSIERRKSSLLGREEWRSSPWQCFFKDRLQRLFDLGFDLGALLERVDLSNGSCSPGSYAYGLKQLPLSYFTVSKKLEKWCNDNWTSQERRWYSLHYEELQDAHEFEPHHQRTRPDFKDIQEATSVVYYWSFKLVLNEIMLSSVRQNSEQEHVTSFQHMTLAQPCNYWPASSSSEFFAATQGQLASSSLRLAIDIVLAAPYFLRDDMGWLGPQKLWFP